MNAIQINNAIIVCPQALQRRQLLLSSSSISLPRLRSPRVSTSLKLTNGGHKKCLRLSPVCLARDGAISGSGDQEPLWKSFGKALENFAKKSSVEDVLKQQIKNQEYYDEDGSGGNPPGRGGGGGGGGGFSESAEPFLVKFEYLCSVELKLEIFKNMLVEKIKKPSLDAYKSIPIVTLTEERLHEMDVAGDLAKCHGWTSTIDLLEKVNVSIKRFKSLRAVEKEEEIYKAVQLSLGNTQFVVQCFALLQVYYHAEVSSEQCAMDLQNLVSYFENQREDLISKFDVLFL